MGLAFSDSCQEQASDLGPGLVHGRSKAVLLPAYYGRVRDWLRVRRLLRTRSQPVRGHWSIMQDRTQAQAVGKKSESDECRKDVYLDP